MNSNRSCCLRVSIPCLPGTNPEHTLSVRLVFDKSLSASSGTDSLRGRHCVQATRGRRLPRRRLLHLRHRPFSPEALPEPPICRAAFLACLPASGTGALRRRRAGRPDPHPALPHAFIHALPHACHPRGLSRGPPGNKLRSKWRVQSPSVSLVREMPSPLPSSPGSSRGPPGNQPPCGWRVPKPSVSPPEGGPRQKGEGRRGKVMPATDRTPSLQVLVRKCQVIRNPKDVSD